MKNDFISVLMLNILRLLSRPLILLLIPLYLTASDQGYWFTFVSLGSLTVLVDLGLTNLILQFSSHEMANLSFSKNTKLIVGDNESLWRLSSLLRLVIKISKLTILFFFPILTGLGLLILSSNIGDSNWLLPWLIYSLTISMYFILNLFLSYVEGLDLVAKVNQIRIIQTIINAALTLFFLYIGLSIYSLAVSMLISCALSAIYFYRNHGIYIKDLMRYSSKKIYSFNSILIPLLWKTSFSYISGYFIFQFFTPMVFIYFGAIFAGKVGFSIGVVMSIFTLSNIWGNILKPKLNIAIAQGNNEKAINYFYISTLLSVITYIIGISCLFILLNSTFSFSKALIDRFVTFNLLSVLSIGWGVQVVINNIAIYVRSHLIEPFAYVSIFSAVLTFIVSWYFSYTNQSDSIFYGFLASYLVTLPMFVYIFIKVKSKNDKI